MDDFVHDTLDCMDIMLKVEEEGECWIWTGSTSNGYPTVKRNRENLYVRSLIWGYTGKTRRPGENITAECGNKLCINPACLKARSISRINRDAAKRGAWKSASRALKISISRRKNPAATKINIDIAREIRTSEEPSRALAERFGVSKTLVGAIRRGDVWSDHANMWSRLGG
jgi:hypothetical protein